MEELLKEILNKINNLERKTEAGFANMSDRIDALDKSNKEGLRQIDRKIDGITDAVMKTMEDITELKDKVEKQEVAIRVIRGGAANG